MSTTKFKIAEQVDRLLGGQPVTNTTINRDDIMLLIGQMCNKFLKALLFCKIPFPVHRK